MMCVSLEMFAALTQHRFKIAKLYKRDNPRTCISSHKFSLQSSVTSVIELRQARDSRTPQSDQAVPAVAGAGGEQPSHLLKWGFGFIAASISRHGQYIIIEAIFAESTSETVITKLRHAATVALLPTYYLNLKSSFSVALKLSIYKRAILRQNLLF
jgi:hypothetical protein